MGVLGTISHVKDEEATNPFTVGLIRCSKYNLPPDFYNFSTGAPRTGKVQIKKRGAVLCGGGWYRQLKNSAVHAPAFFLATFTNYNFWKKFEILVDPRLKFIGVRGTYSYRGP